jgi:hypothetical protein
MSGRNYSLRSKLPGISVDSGRMAGDPEVIQMGTDRISTEKPASLGTNISVLGDSLGIRKRKT